MRQFTRIALLGALAYVPFIPGIRSFLEFSLPFLPSFLKYDPSEIPALVATFALSPVAGIAVELIKGALIFLLSPIGAGGPFGIFMDLLAGVTLVSVAGLYYLIEHTKAGAIKALAYGVLAMTAMMIFANIVLTPIFYGIPRPQVIALILPGLLPFNLLKGTLSAVVTYLVYKRVRVYLYEWIGDRVAW